MLLRNVCLSILIISVAATIYIVYPRANSISINHFYLHDQYGHSFTEKNMQGKWSMVFFGFTNCAMVCPTTMAALRDMYITLQVGRPLSELPQVIFISIDPERDTQSRLQTYMAAFNSQFIGLTGDKTHIGKLMQSLKILSTKITASTNNTNQYTLIHSSDVMLFGPHLDLQATISYPQTSKQLLHVYQLARKHDA